MAEGVNEEAGRRGGGGGWVVTNCFIHSLWTAMEKSLEDTERGEERSSDDCSSLIHRCVLYVCRVNGLS